MRPTLSLLKKSGSSNRWLARQQSDPFVNSRSSSGRYRSRASYKLLQLAERYPHIMPAGGTIVDLGCAPGGWAQVAADKVGKRGRVIGVDLLPVRDLGEGYEQVSFIQGDFLSPEIYQQLVKTLPRRSSATKVEVDAVLSDMMANMTGVRIRDVENSLELCRSALMFAVQYLRRPTAGGM
jgi:23S rRNA (uridine2552-2'-O)-methyltransferase